MSFNYTVVGTTIEASSEPDLFSPKGLDIGTRLLLECLPRVILSEAKDLDSSSLASQNDMLCILDWGCGWGAIALYAAKRFPQAQVTALDSDIAAVETCKQNALLNEIGNLEVVASHSFAQLPANQTFDMIVSNPPTHRGREVVDNMIAEAKDRLNQGGSILLVVEARIKPWVARQLKATFGEYRIVKRSAKHVVLIASK
jgi:16S rRNA (guanine1207-N2)-methyltransferase